jgi:tetratricopeptide (TPR) repeat protein
MCDCSKNINSSAPLEGNPARQASASLRGYDYQIWRSVEAWMMLDEGQILYLECAEDFDIVGEQVAETVQVKNSGVDISLGSKDVRDAIENFWITCLHNPEHASITMRFLTRGGIRSEMGKPFGSEKGIEVWRRAAGGNDVAALQVGQFLNSLSFDNALLKDFLATASAPALREQLITRIVWATSEPSEDVIRLRVERMAIKLGRKRDISEHASVVAVDGLLAHCHQTAAQSTLGMRSLTVEDKLRIFEEKTTSPLPITHANLALLSHAVYSTDDALGGVHSVTFAPASLGSEPALPPYVLVRTAIVEDIVRAGTATLIVGSEGRGKTTLASLVARSLKDIVRWIDLSSVKDSLLPVVLDQLLLELRGTTTLQTIVLDDFPVAGGIEQHIWVRFDAIVQECSLHSNFLITTAKGVDPTAIDPRFRVAHIAIHSVPDLTIPEILEFVTALSCPEHYRDQWSARILGQSGGGHPKLVYLMGRELRDLGWPEPTEAVSARPPRSIEEARNFARKEAARTLPEGERELLYGLSLAFYPLNREAVLELGFKVAGLQAPGDILDHLVGRWVEVNQSNDYTATALIAGQATSAWRREKIESTHAFLFDLMLGRRLLTVDQAFPILRHAWESGDENRLGGYLIGLAGETGTICDTLFEYLAQAILIARGKEISLARQRFNVRTLVLLKNVQFRIARLQFPSELPALAQEWDDEIRRLPDGKIRDGSRLMWAFSVANCPDMVLPATTLVQALENLDRLELIFPEAFPQGMMADLFPNGEDGDGDHVATLFAFNFARCDDLDFLGELLSALEQVAPRARQRMLKAFDYPFFTRNHLFIDSPFVMEAKRAKPRWKLAEKTLLRMLALAGEWKCNIFGILVARTLSILYEDHLKHGERAIVCLREAAVQFSESPVLIAQEASVLFGRKDFRSALDLWNKSLWRSKTSPRGVEQDPNMLRKAGIAAGSFGDYEQASEWFEAAARCAKDMKLQATAGGALFDAAYCAFKDSAWDRTINLAHSGLLAFAGEFDPTKQLDLFVAKRLGVGILSWMLGQLRTNFGESQPEPVFGQCSNTGQNKEIVELPKCPEDVAVVMLVEIASLLDVQGVDIDRLRARIENTKIPAAKFQYWALRCNEAILSDRLEEICKCLLALHRTIWMANAQRRNGDISFTPFIGTIEPEDRAQALGTDAVFVAALFLQAISKRSPQKLADSWLFELEGEADAESLRVEIHCALQSFTIDPLSALKFFVDTKANPIKRFGAGCRLLIERGRSPVETAQRQKVVMILMRKLASSLIFDGMLPTLARTFATMWREHMETPALLLSPRISVPLITDVIESKDTAPEKLLKLFDAVEMATGIAASKELRKELHTMSIAYSVRNQR